MSELNIPDSWAESDLKNVLEVQSGYAFKSKLFSDSEGMPLIRIRDLKNNNTETYYTGEYKEEFIVRNGDLLIGMDGNFICYEWTGGEALLNQRVCRLKYNKNAIEKKFILYGINKELADIQHRTVKVTVGHISGRQIGAINFPLPPLDEQKRIVLKIETCFEKIIKAEQNLSQAELLIQKYRESLLAKAFRGDLLEQDANDQSARTSLSNIVEGVRSSKQKNKIVTILEDDIQYKLPDSWVWCSLTQVGVLARGKSKHRPRNDKKLFGGDYPFIQTGDIARADLYITKHEQSYNELGLAQSRLFPENTLCITIAANIGETAILSYPACFPDSIVGYTPYNGVLLVKYVMFYFEFIKRNLEHIAPGAAQKNINLNILSKLPFPLPPYEEQKRIVNKIEHSYQVSLSLLELIKTKKQRLNSFKNAILNKAFSGELVKQVEQEGTGHELLKTIFEEKKNN